MCPQTCQVCPPGTFTQLNESTGCLPCPNKTYAPSYGMASCLPCTTVETEGSSVCPPPPIITTFFGGYTDTKTNPFRPLAFALPHVCVCVCVCVCGCTCVSVRVLVCLVDNQPNKNKSS